MSYRTVTAYSLLEVVLATGICAGALVPALALLRDGMQLAERIDTRHLLLICAISKMEEQMAIVAANWTRGTFHGNFSADGHATIRYTVSCSDDPADGGIAGRLMSVMVTTFRDEDGNNLMDSHEMHTTLTTKIGKFASYESKANT